MKRYHFECACALEGWRAEQMYRTVAYGLFARG